MSEPATGVGDSPQPTGSGDRNNRESLSGTLGEFAELVAAGTATPGGGSVAAYCGVLATALGRMMCNLTIGRKKHESVGPRAIEIRGELERHGARLRELIDEDAASFELVMAACRLPKGTESEKSEREHRIEAAAVTAIEVPAETAERAIEVARLLVELSVVGNSNAMPDLTTAAQLVVVAVKGASYNIKVNLSMIKDERRASAYLERIDALVGEAQGLAIQVEARN
jgi:glutamate formiminotransferase/formiminotetrahydrofolate cyclodeaminase